MSENAMSDTEFHQLADGQMETLFEALEAADHHGALDVEYHDDAITFELAGKKQYVISKHRVSRQIWLSSPVSGGLHFRYEAGQWVIPDGRTLQTVLMHELSLHDIAVNL